MFSLNTMGFNKPLNASAPRQYGTNVSHPQSPNMVLLKPEHLGNNHFNFLNDFGIQSHLINDKKFADINSAIPQCRNSYPTNYNTSPSNKPEQTQKATIPHPSKAETFMHHKNNSKTPKKCRRKRKQTRRDNSEKSSKPKKSSNLQVMDVEESPTDSIKIVEVVEIATPFMEVSSFSPCKSPVFKFEGGSTQEVRFSPKCEGLRRPSECESEDSFIVFDHSSPSSLESDDLHSSDESNDDDDGIDSLDSSVDDLWPTKRVRFASDKDLCEVHPMVQWSYAYQKARKGPWEQIALDRTRFSRRISGLESTLSVVLAPEHRNKIFTERFLTDDSL